MTRAFVGRGRELDLLKSLLRKKSASFVVIRGRRRIGKSRLIQEFGKSAHCHTFTGLPPKKGVGRQAQLDEFCEQVAQEFQIPKFQVSGWSEAFAYLAKLTSKEPRIVALDEISWIGSKDSSFLGHLKNAWDLHFSQNPQLILIVCGSVSSWIEDNILKHTGFLGRISIDLRLDELPLVDAAKFWNAQRQRVSVHDVLKVLAVTGGVPRYLEEVQPEFSAEAIIRGLCFQPTGLLYREFDQIFSDLFSVKASAYREVVQALVSGSRSLGELSVALGRPDSTVANALNDLIQGGFVSRDASWNLQTMRPALKKFRLSDNYVRFYLKYIQPNKQAIEQGVFSARSLASLPEWETIMGLQFENLVTKNAFALLRALKLEPSDLELYGPFFQRRTQRKRGCQIDLLIQTRYRTVFICETKFSLDPIGPEAIKQLEQKQEAIALPRGWSKRLVLIHVNGVTNTVFQTEAIDHIIDFSELLGLD